MDAIPEAFILTNETHCEKDLKLEFCNKQADSLRGPKQLRNMFSSSQELDESRQEMIDLKIFQKRNPDVRLCHSD